MTRGNLLLTGGPGHEFAHIASLLAALLAADGTDTTVVEEPTELFDRLATSPDGWDLVTVHALRWRMLAERYAPDRDRWAFTIAPEHEQVLEDHVRGGGGLLALHTAVICFDPSRRWHDLIGGSWDWDRSTHPPVGPVRVRRTDAGARHPVTAGIGDFTVRDEAYLCLDLEPDVVALAGTEHDGAAHPLVWAREVGAGRVVTDLLGHDRASIEHPEHVALLRAAARWAARPIRDDETRSTRRG